MSWKTLDDLNLSGKTVLVRVDLNVPFDGKKVTDYTRITRLKPTLAYLIAANAKPVLLSHFGRPKGEVVPSMSLEPIATAMREHLGLDVVFSSETIGPNAKAAIDALKPGQVLVLENTRFFPGETKNDPTLAQDLAKLGDVYCNDAFSAAHRAHASTEGLARLLPSCAGRLMEVELRALEKALATPVKPVVAVVGGAKISTKLDLLGNLIKRVDHLVIGGAMANTFLAAKGYAVGASLYEKDLLETARAIMEAATQGSCTIHLPVDIVTAKSFEPNVQTQIFNATDCPQDAMILDAGPKTTEAIKTIFAQSKTLVWNGPLGAFEVPPFDAATNACAQYAAKLTENGKLMSVAGGGDTVAALNNAGVGESFTYISTAGGAFLEWLEGKTLPGIEALV